VNTPQSVLPDSQTAYNNLFMGVHQRVFFNKLAAAGHAPRTQEEAQWMLETAGKLRTVDQSIPVKQANDAQSPYYQANQALDRVMQQYGLGARPAHAEQELAIKHAAAALSNDPTLYNSILALKMDEAEALRQQLTQPA
jgi:hypothetical protein